MSPPLYQLVKKEFHGFCLRGSQIYPFPGIGQSNVVINLGLLRAALLLVESVAGTTEEIILYAV